MIVTFLLLFSLYTPPSDDPIIVNLKQVQSPLPAQSALNREDPVKAGVFEIESAKRTVFVQGNEVAQNPVIQFCSGATCLPVSRWHDVVTLGDHKLEILSLTSEKAVLVKTQPHLFAQNAPKKGVEAPNFLATSTDGEVVKLSDFRGRYVFLDFWGTWCVPCLEQMPLLEGAKIRFEDELVIIGIAKDNPASIKTYTENRPVQWLQIAEGLEGGNIQRLYGVTAYPTAFLINPEGKIILRNQRWLSGTQIMRTLNWILLGD